MQNSIKLNGLCKSNSADLRSCFADPSFLLSISFQEQPIETLNEVAADQNKSIITEMSTTVNPKVSTSEKKSGK